MLLFSLEEHILREKLTGRTFQENQQKLDFWKWKTLKSTYWRIKRFPNDKSTFTEYFFLITENHITKYKGFAKSYDLAILCCSKNVRELSCMSLEVMRFWFLLNFIFISAFSDILVSLISRVLSKAFQVDENPPI